MHQAMKEIARLKKQEKVSFQLSINVSVQQFMQDNFKQKI